MNTNVVRMLFSSIAAAVFLMTSAEWIRWGRERGQPWRYLVGVGLGALAIFEGNVVWRRIDGILS